MKTTTKPNPELLYCCPERIVRVLRKTSRLRRRPRHKHPAVLFVLRPRPGTRVQMTRNGAVEFMAAYDEVIAFLVGTDPALAKILPASLCNKPIARKRYHDRRNAKPYRNQ